MFVLGIAVLGWTATFRPITALGAYALVVAAALATTIQPQGVSPDSAIAAFCMLGLIFVIRTLRLNMGARRSAERGDWWPSASTRSCGRRFPEAGAR